MVEWDHAFKHNHKQSRYKLHNNGNSYAASCSRETAYFVVLILTQWLITGIYNIHHTSQKLCYVLRAEKATVLTFNMVWVVTLLYEFSIYEVSTTAISCFHKSLMNTQIAVEHELMLCTQRIISSPNAQTSFALSGSSPSVLHCGSVAAAQALRPTLTQLNGNLRAEDKTQLPVSLLMCCHTIANYKS